MYRHFFKRLIDILLSGIGIIVLSPVWLILMLAILINDPGPVFFTQKRVGIHKKYFFANKFVTARKIAQNKDILTFQIKYGYVFEGFHNGLLAPNYCEK